MRKNSTTVRLGEFVEQGQMLGMIGSSGFSFQAHVHWEAGYFISGNWIFQESHTGPFNLLPSLWNDQKRYIGMDSGACV